MFHINITQKELGEVWLVVLVREIPAALLTYSLFPRTNSFQVVLQSLYLVTITPKAAKKPQTKPYFYHTCISIQIQVQSVDMKDVSQVPSVKKEGKNLIMTYFEL